MEADRPERLLNRLSDTDLPKMGDFSTKLSLLAGGEDDMVENKGSGLNFGDDESLGTRLAVNRAPTDSFDYTDKEFVDPEVRR